MPGRRGGRVYALGAVMATLLMTAGCMPAQPQTLETGESIDAPVPTPTPTSSGLDYTTTLTLSENEKKAADEARDSLVGFLEVLNTVYREGEDEKDLLSEVAKDNAYELAKSDVKGFREAEQHIEGKIGISSLDLQAVDIDASDDTQIPFVTFEACMPTEDFYYVDSNGEEVDGADNIDPAEVVFTSAMYDGEWYVSEQTVQGYEC